MGNCGCDRNDIKINENEDEEKIKASDFTKLYPIAKWSLGPVWKVTFNKKNKLKNSEDNQLK